MRQKMRSFYAAVCILDATRLNIAHFNKLIPGPMVPLSLLRTCDWAYLAMGHLQAHGFKLETHASKTAQDNAPQPPSIGWS